MRFGLWHMGSLPLKMNMKKLINYIIISSLLASSSGPGFVRGSVKREALRPVSKACSAGEEAGLSEELRRSSKYFALEWCEQRLQEARNQFLAGSEGRAEAILHNFDQKLLPYVANGLLLDDPEEVWDQLGRDGVDTSDKLEQIFILERKKQALIAVRKNRYYKDGFIKTIAVYDPGKYGYIIDTVGFPESWSIGILAESYRDISTGEILRFTKSFAYIMERINDGIQQVDSDVFGPDSSVSNIYIVESLEEIDRFVPIDTQLWELGPGLYLQIDGKDITVFATKLYLTESRIIQRRRLRHFFEHPDNFYRRSFAGDESWQQNIERRLKDHGQELKVDGKKPASMKTGIILTNRLKHIYRTDGESLKDSSSQHAEGEDIAASFMRNLLFEIDDNQNMNFEFWIERKYLEDCRNMVREIKRFYDLPIIRVNIIENVDIDDIHMDDHADVHLRVGCGNAVPKYFRRKHGPDRKPAGVYDMPDEFSRSDVSSETRILFTRAYSDRDHIDLYQVLGIRFLSDVLERRGYRVNIMNNPNVLAEYGTKNIYCISATLVNIKETQELVSDIRKNDPGGFIIFGGPAASTPEHVLSNIEGIDILIKGEAEDVLPEVVDIIAATRTRHDLSSEQLTQLASLKGVYVRSGRMIRAARLSSTNFVTDIQLPVLCGTNQISFARGCPYDCNFCNKFSGRRFRSATAATLIEHLIGRVALAVDLPDQITDAILGLFGINDLISYDDLGKLKKNNYIFRMPLGKWHVSSKEMIDLIEIFEGATITDNYFTGWRFRLDKAMTTTIRSILRIAEGADSDIKADIRSAKIPFTRRMMQDIVFAFRKQWARVLIELNEQRDGDMLAVAEDGYIKKGLLVWQRGDEALSARRKFITVAGWIKQHRFNRFMKIMAGQSSIASIYNFSHQRPRVEYLQALQEANIRLARFGIDGMSNHILDVHNKDGYRIGHILECYVAGRRIGVSIRDNNNLTFNPFATLLDVAEVAALITLLPFALESSPATSIYYCVGSSFGNENIIAFPDKVLERNEYILKGEQSEYGILDEHKGRTLEPFSAVDASWNNECKVGPGNEFIYRLIGRYYLNDHEDEIIARWREDADPEMNALADIYMILRRRSPAVSAWSIIEEIKAMTVDITFKGRDDFGYFRYLLRLLRDDVGNGDGSQGDRSQHENQADLPDFAGSSKVLALIGSAA